jgi:two-component system sensor histidine kinase MtrB
VSGTGSPATDPLSFRRRLTLSFVLVGAATGAVLVAASLFTISTYRHRSFVRGAREEAQLSLLPGPARFSPERVDDLIQAYRQRGGFETVIVTPTKVATSSPAVPAAAVPPSFADQVTGGVLQQRETTIHGRPYLLLGGTPAPGVKVFFFFSLSGLNHGVREFAVVLSLWWALAVVASAAFGNMLARTRIQALSESRERERRFTSDVAHELRTPLAAMVSAAGMLGEELDTLPASARPPAALLVKDVSRLSELVQELLELARLDSGQEGLHVERLRLAEALAVVTRTLVPTDQPIVVDVAPDIEVLADRARFRRVMANLLSNAIRHGGGEITIRARRAGTEAAIEIADRGPGIRPESLERIFDRFHKEDTARSAAGSGLGLAIALEHAKAQGGTVRAANRVGGGACFTFTLPLAAPSPVFPGAAGGAPDRAAAASAAPPPSDRAATRATPPAGG